MVGSVRTPEGAVARIDGERSWTAGEELGSGGQGYVFAARDATGETAHLADLVRAVQRAASPHRTSPEDDPGPHLAAALRRVVGGESAFDFALKIYRPREGEDPSSAWRRSEQEVRVLSEISHPHIVRVEDFGVLQDQRRFAVFPRFRMGNLLQAQRDYVGNPRKALRSLASLLDAIATLHGRGFVHRDIKPENVFLSEVGFVLADFGLVLAKDRAESVTRVGEIVGNWQFGPDWAHLDTAKQDDPRVDLYAVAKLLWWLLSGKPLLRREDWSELEFNLTTLFPDEPAMRLVNRILAKGLGDRPGKVQYANALAMKKHFLAVLEEIESHRHPSRGSPGACRACQEGRYAKVQHARLRELEEWKHEINNAPPKPRVQIVGVDLYRCSSCGHLVWYATHPEK